MRDYLPHRYSKKIDKLQKPDSMEDLGTEICLDTVVLKPDHLEEQMLKPRKTYGTFVSCNTGNWAVWKSFQHEAKEMLRGERV